MARVVVVGAGMAGLAVAARLAALGHDVVVCEQADDLGRQARHLQRDGFIFDTGPSLLTLPAVYRDLFLKTGRPLEESLDLVPVDPVARYRFPAVGGHDVTWLDCPTPRRARLRAALDDALGAGAGADWERFLDRARDIWQVTREPFLESPLTGGARPAAAGPAYVGRPHRGAVADAARAGRSSTCATRGCGCSSTATRPTPAPTRAARRPRWPWCPTSSRRSAPGTSPAGCAGSGRRCSRAPRMRGARLRTGAAVARGPRRGRPGAGRAAGRRRAVGGRRRRRQRRRRSPLRRPAAPVGRRPGPAPAGPRYAVAVGVRAAAGAARPDPGAGAPHGAVPGRLRRGVRRGLRPASAPARPVDDPTVYVSAPDDPALRPDDDHEAWFVLVNAPRHGSGPGAVDWDAAGLAQSYADRVLEVLAARGLDVRDRLLWREVRTPADLERATRAPGGAIYGTSSNGARAAFLRPANASPVPGLFLVGRLGPPRRRPAAGRPVGRHRRRAGGPGGRGLTLSAAGAAPRRRAG